MEFINNSNNTRPVESNSVDVSRFIMSVYKKDAVIFCRVSSIGQTGKFSISFEVQEHKGYICADLFKLKVMSVVKVVESAYDGKSCTIKSLIYKNRGKNIIIYNVSRFCRNIQRGEELLNYALSHNTRLFFVEEGIVWDRRNRDALDKLREHLYLAQEESKAIGRRVKDALAEKKRRGFFTGGTPKYGFTLVEEIGGKRVVPNDSEQAVITFINACRQVGTTVNQLNVMMNQLSDFFDQPIELFYDGVPIELLAETLNHTTIANLLNSYGVYRRGKAWKPSSVGEILRRNYNDVLNDLDKMDIE